MSESFNVQTVTLVSGPMSGATPRPMYRVPTAGGGITVLEGFLTDNSGGGTVSTSLGGTAVAACLVTFGTIGAANGTAGTTLTVDGTIGYFGGLGSITLGPGTVHTLLLGTAGTAYVGPGKFVGFKETAGTILGGYTVSLAYVLGK